MSDFKPTPREKNALDNNKFNLTAKNEKGYRANMVFELNNNNPRITIYTGLAEEKDDKDKNYGRIQGKLDAPTFMLIVNGLDDLAKNGEGKKVYSIDNMKQKFANNKPVDEWFVINTIKFGRDDDGQIWMSIVERNRPKIKFIFTNPSYHVLKNADGSDLPPGDVSRLYTMAWCGVMRALLGPVMNTHYVPPKPRDAGGNGGGGGNRGGYNNGGNKGNYRSNGGGGGGNSGGSSESSFEGTIDDELWA